MTRLNDKRIAFLLTDGYEVSELTSPWEAVTSEGATAVLISPKENAVKSGDHEQKVDVASNAASASDYDALVLPGGTSNADHIRMDPAAVELVRRFVAQGKLVAAICHGAWILADADALRGKTVTSYLSLRTDLRNAGAEWVDREVVVDGNFVTSRTPDDLPAFNQQIIAQLS